MSDLVEMMKSDPARLVIQYAKAQNGDDQFNWGVVKYIPIMNLVGRLSLIQHQIDDPAGWVPECEEPALVVLVDPETKELCHFLSPAVPKEPLVGMVEIVKQILVTSRIAAHAGAQKVQLAVPNKPSTLFGPDGRPMRPD